MEALNFNDDFFSDESYEQYIKDEKEKPKKKKRLLATLDIETDPFLYGREPQPFCCGFYCEELDLYKEFWGEDCLYEFLDFIELHDDNFHIFAHNGGTFDFIYFLRMGCFNSSHIQPNVINGRIVKAYFSDHIFQDSYAIMPLKLSKMGNKPMCLSIIKIIAITPQRSLETP